MGIHQGSRLEYFIERQGKTKEELAKLSGISRGSFFSYLKMEKIPSDKLEKICDVLNIDYIKEFKKVKNDELEQLKRDLEICRREKEELTKEVILLQRELLAEKKPVKKHGTFK